MKNLLSAFGGGSVMKYILWAVAGLAAFFLVKNKVIPVLTGAQGKQNPDTSGTLHANVPAAANSQTTALANRIVPTTLEVRKLLANAGAAASASKQKQKTAPKKPVAALGNMIRIAPKNEFDLHSSDVVPYIKKIPAMPNGVFNPYEFNIIK